MYIPGGFGNRGATPVTNSDVLETSFDNFRSAMTSSNSSKYTLRLLNIGTLGFSVFGLPT